MQRLFITVLLALTTSLASGGSREAASAAWERKDYLTVLNIIRPPALKGEAWAQMGLGYAYAKGQGTVQDYAEAVKWYRLSADQGYAGSQRELGASYENGWGVMQDYSEAVKWYRLAAQQGLLIAQYNLGVMYFLGRGVVQDYVKAHVWFNLGAVKGSADAVKSRAEMANLMTQQQIAEAQKKARDCQAQKFKGCE